MHVQCPRCVELKSLSNDFIVRLSGYAYRSIQLALKQIGVYHAANTITLAKVE